MRRGAPRKCEVLVPKSCTKKSTAGTGKPAQVRQPHGGALYAGGVPGHRGGPGRPPSVLRELLRGSFAERLAVLEAIADGQPVVRVRLPDGTETETLVSASPADRLRALDLMAKYGLGTQMGLPVNGAGEETPTQVIIMGGREIRF